MTSIDEHDETATKLHQTTNARAWAQEFCDRFRVALEGDGAWIDDPEGLMIGWFANAIETGRDHEARESPIGCDADGCPVVAASRETCRGPDGSNACTLPRFHEGDCVPAEDSPS